VPLLNTEPTVIVRDLLISNWQSANITESFNPVWISTGRYDNATDHPEITITGVSEDRSPDAMRPDGTGLSAWVDGIMDINAWVPLSSDYQSSGVAKSFRYDLEAEIDRIIDNNQRGTTDATNAPQLTRLETGTAVPTIENDEEPVLYRARIPVGYQYYKAPE
jgi:hypothetical protein